jgi:hypothetical protein
MGDGGQLGDAITAVTAAAVTVTAAGPDHVDGGDPPRPARRRSTSTS